MKADCSMRTASAFWEEWSLQGPKRERLGVVESQVHVEREILGVYPCPNLTAFKFVLTSYE